MSSIDDLFSKLRSENRKALMPFVTAGDPDLEFTSAVIEELVARGASMCEVGIPYSDPIADGQVIQESYTRALSRGIKVSDILQTLGQLAPRINGPLVTMVSHAIIYRHGMERYADALQDKGIAGMIVPDLPVDESDGLAAVCKTRDLSLIQLVTPTTSRDRALKIADTSSGFLYYVSVAGITGERSVVPQELQERVGWLREQTSLPVCIGFGISQPEHVRVLCQVADGLIVGSAIVRRMADAATDSRDQALRQVGDYLSSLLAVMDAR
ncbi:MAG: tryptophan synthase subunit alpha [Pirellulales bacterium]|nr:tryptophan synthase subunit alpha [Pirellulales bacterium]